MLISPPPHHDTVYHHNKLYCFLKLRTVSSLLSRPSEVLWDLNLRDLDHYSCIMAWHIMYIRLVIYFKHTLNFAYCLCKQFGPRSANLIWIQTAWNSNGIPERHFEINHMSISTERPCPPKMMLGKPSPPFCIPGWLDNIKSKKESKDQE